MTFFAFILQSFQLLCQKHPNHCRINKSSGGSGATTFSITTLSIVTLSVMTLRIKGSLATLCSWVPSCWTSCFVYCYAGGHYAKCHYAECCYAKRHYAECHYAECCYAECRYAECRGTHHMGQVFLRIPEVNEQEAKSCLFHICNNKLHSFATKKSKLVAQIQPSLKLKTLPRFCSYQKFVKISCDLCHIIFYGRKLFQNASKLDCLSISATFTLE
jgi:hypothetical protein